MPLYAPTLDNIEGFTGGSLGDQLRKKKPKLIVAPVAADPTVDAPPKLLTPPAVVLPQLEPPVLGDLEVEPSAPEYGIPRRFGQAHIGPDGRLIGSLGDDPADRLKLLQGAKQDQRVIQTPAGWEVQPPKHMSRKTGMGEGFKQGARLGASNGFAGMLGGGLARMILGGVDPGSVEKFARAQEIAKVQGQANQSYQQQRQQAELEDQQAQTELRRNAPVYRKEDQNEHQRDNLAQAWKVIVDSGQEFSADNPDHVRIHDEAAKLGIALPYGVKPAKPQPPKLMSVNPGAVVIDEATGEPVYTAAPKPEPQMTPYQNYEIQQKREERRIAREAAQGEVNSLTEQEKAAAAEKDRAVAEVGRLQSAIQSSNKDVERKNLQHQLETARQRLNGAQKFYESFTGKKTEAQKRVDANKDLPEYTPQSKSLNETEQKIYNAAKAKNLDPDKAVKRYREGTY